MNDERLRELTGRLPSEIEPRRDLFPGVVDGITGAARHEARRGSRLPWLAAAAALLIGLALLPAAWRQQAPAVPAAGDAIAVAEAEFERAAQQLLEAYSATAGGSGRLSPETRALLERHLQQIDIAIAQMRGVLAEDPTDGDGAVRLAGLHRQKIDLLLRMTRLES